MSTGTWHRAGLAGLLAASLASCAHERRAPPPTTAQAPAAPQPPTQAGAPQPAPQPPSRQDELADAQRRLEAAHQDVVAAQQQLAAAQQREEQERANVQQLEIQARQDLDRASRLAYQAEQAQGLQTANGRIAEATPSRVVLQLHDGRTMSFHVDQRTRVLVGSEQRSVSDIQQGADARVAFDPKGDERTAITIRVAPVASDPGAPRAPGSPTFETEPPSRR